MLRLSAAPVNSGTLARIGAAARPTFIRTAAVIALAKIAVGLAALVAALSTDDGDLVARHGLMFAHVAVFAATGLLLILGGRRDRRAIVLGTAFLLVASVFADQLVTIFRGATSGALTVARGLSALQVDAFSPYLIWLFIREFPRASQLGTGRRRLRIASNVSFTVGMVFFAANVIAFVASLRPEWDRVAAALYPFSRHNNNGLYWTAQFALSIAALPVLLWRSRRADIGEHRRASLLVWGIVVGATPTILWVLVTGFFPAVRALLPLRVAGWVIYPTLLSTPVTTAYAVLMRHALDVRLVIRRAAQYALARYSVTTLAIVPIIWLAVSLYARRTESIVSLAGTWNFLLFVMLSGVGVLALGRRRALLESIDRRFFREQYDARVIMSNLVERCRSATTRSDLADLLRVEIDRALHLHGVYVLFLDPVMDLFMSPRGEVRSLDARSALAALVAKSLGAVDADIERSDSLVAALSDDDHHWLVDGGVRLLLPLRNAERRVVGLLALGEKRSELPYSKEDEALLAAVASAAEMTIAFHGLEPRSIDVESRTAPQVVPEPCAAECETCGNVQPAGTIVCGRCASAMRECPLPEVIGAKLRIEQRIGAGGMGVVYRGTDLDLDRAIAIKTLPFVFPEEAMRLRREAKAMALVSHPNLALIFGVETWHGRPMLVCEYLPGGTLATRIKSGPVGIADALDLGIDLASALDAIHRAGVLHLDVKPSNIGFGLDGTPKLLDFGIARMLTATVENRRGSPLRDRGSSALVTQLSADEPGGKGTAESVLRGTLLYMSPEALFGEAPHASFDLWSLSLVLYEAIAGRNPLHEPSMQRTRARILTGDVPDIRLHVTAAPSELAEFFRRAFSSVPTDRPESAAVLRDRLRTIRGAIVAAPAQDTAPTVSTSS